MTAQCVEDSVLLDQLKAVRGTVAISLPINIALGVAVLLVAINSGAVFEGILWFILSLLVNLTRMMLCRYPIHGDVGALGLVRLNTFPLEVSQHLTAHWVTSLLSGCVWALIAFLCDGFTTQQTLFYLTVICGITAGAVTHGFAYSRIPILFIIPPLLSVFVCLVWVGGFDRYVLAASVVLYLGALIRGTRVGEVFVRNESRLKNEATSLYHSLELANEQATCFAKEMQERSHRDDLTGILNRRGFSEVVENMDKDAANGGLMILDLDGFKSVNDVFGHKIGDQILIEVASRLIATSPDGVTLARIGGDEFAALFDETWQCSAIEALARNYIAVLAQKFPKIEAGRMGVSIGIYCGSATNFDDMLIYADTALYAAKNDGRNRCRVFDEALRSQVQMRIDIERELPDILDRGGLSLWYQPIMADSGKRLDSFEALLRWHHHKHGWIPPMEIVRIAAVTGLSEQLLKYILQSAMQMCASLKAQNMSQIRVAINVSPREMSQLHADQLIFAALLEYDISPKMIEIEITEEIAINPRLIFEKLKRLTDIGIHLALDDFGSGYSSLGSLQQLNVHRVKIDRAFVTGSSHSGTSRSLVDAVLRVSQAYGFDVVAEGIETEADLITLRDMGCSIMQGHYFSRPMTADAALAWAMKRGQVHDNIEIACGECS